MQLLHSRHALRPICFYTNVRERLRHQHEYPELHSDVIAAAYDVRNGRLAEFAGYLETHYSVAAVIPFSEHVLLNAVELARRLKLDWAQPAIMRRFRDKFALKDHLRQCHPALRMTASRCVSGLADIRSSLTAGSFSKFVLKPNDGYGNRSIGLFDADTGDEPLLAYLQAQRDPVLMEEYVDGDEYFVNGQMDANGNVIIVAVFAYHRIAANQRHNIDYETRRVASTDPLFTTLAGYASQVMRATGLKRSPFHMEIKIDAHGPCLIEVGARLVGHGNADVCGRMHGDLDLFDLAAHYYVSDADYGPIPLDWDRYNASEVRYVHGIAGRRERIYSLHGVEEAEAMPEFVQWARKPEAGITLERTVDCLSMPWSAVIRASGIERADAAAKRLRSLLHWNARVSIFTKALINARTLSHRYAMALRVRLLPVMEHSDHPHHCPAYRRIKSPSSFFDIFPALMSKFRSFIDNAAYRLQLLGWRSPFAAAIDNSYEDPVRAPQIITWAESYLAQPHPLLNRKGAVCPFVQYTINRGGFAVSFHDEIDGRSVLKMRRVILDEAVRFQRKFPRDVHKGMFSSVVIVFPNLQGDDEALVERMHGELKTHFMKSDLMCSPFHATCTKPSVSNPEFEVFRAPFAGFVVRHMDVRDIAFLAHNRDAFARYRQRFAELFARGEVGNEYGYVDLYEQACARFVVSK
ncbi:MAG TPA: ATP-grasp domain-containing protein [Steroidobacteraceae bacterium]|nr:ATP-grasp domain-containing protein [Steroidobacteraceae bacterium]